MTANCEDCFRCKHGQYNNEEMFIGCDSDECKYEPTETASTSNLN